VFLGRLVQRKGCEQLIVAFANLSRRIPEAELVIAGTGPQREKLKKLTKASGLEGRISFLGYIDEKDKPGLLASADIACFPSLYGESFGIVLLEAMAAGAGVVLGGDNPGYRSVLGDQPDLLIDPADTDAFTGKLEQLLEDRRLHRRLHKWQSEAVKQYDIEVVGPKVVDLYRSSIAKARKKSHNTHHGKP
jgi:phosphatidylinositol alpha-mannosyltransferase